MNQYVCRCCLLENPIITYNIFDSDLRLQLLECVPNLSIEQDDGLPDVICDMCCIHLREILDFRRKCHESESELKKHYEETNRAIEQALFSAVSGETSNLNSFENLDDTMLNDLLLEDYSLCDISNSSFEEDPILAEIFNDVLANPNSSSLQEGSKQCDITKNQLSPAVCDANIVDNKNELELLKLDSTILPINDKSSKHLYSCTECEKKFTRNFQLKLHMNSVHNLGLGIQYRCHECKKDFASRPSLRYHHKAMHSSDRPYACVHCARTFVLRTQLSSHLRIHTGEAKPRVHECTLCGKFWPTKSDLRTHMRSHDPDVERPYKCDRCEKGFFTRGHLQSHHLVHTGEKPFSCDFCGKCYQNIGNLNNHMVRHHAKLLFLNDHNNHRQI